MSKKYLIDDGGPAFPVSTGREEDGEYGHQSGYSTWQFPGMTLRDWFAGQALVPILSVLREGIRPEDLGHMARDCYGVADAMIAARKAPDHSGDATDMVEGGGK